MSAAAIPESPPTSCHCLCDTHRADGMFCQTIDAPHYHHVYLIRGIINPKRIPMCHPCSHWWTVRQPDRTVPSRLVDGHDQGWYLVGPIPADDSGDPFVFQADYGTKRGLISMEFERLRAERGPTRPVVAPTAAENAIITEALLVSKQKAAGTLAVALYRTFVHSQARQEDPTDYDRAVRRIMAGREGSWESDGLPFIAWEIGASIAEKPRRFHEAAATAIAGVLINWTHNPHRYVEVAETLASTFGEVADMLGGWDAVADQWLRERAGDFGSIPQHGTSQLKNWLMSRAETREG